MDLILCSIDIKILNYYKKKFVRETKHLTNFDFDKYELIKKKFLDYKLSTNLIYTNPKFYLELKEIEFDFTRDFNELACLEIIWLTHHFEFVQEIKSTKNDICQLIKFAKKNKIISFIQYEYIKKILPKINKIFDYDKSMEKFYLPKKNLKLYLTIDEIKLFYDILDIVLIEIDKLYLIYQKEN